LYFLFLEFIGTTEVIFIAIVALIIFGPRKMPDIARQIGKTMNDLRRVSTEFRETWEREVALEDEKPKNLWKTDNSEKISETSLAELENRSIAGNKSEIIDNTIVSEQPTVKEIDISRMNLPKETLEGNENKELAMEAKVNFLEKKRDWL
jgi:Tat protein translocase TatB subunit